MEYRQHKYKGGYGTLPVDLGKVDIINDESCLCLYMPIKLKNRHHYVIPEHLVKYQPILDFIKGDHRDDVFHDKYIYLTVKAQFVSGEHTGQREGWHSDGFMTDDINYIWYDSHPTEFLDLEQDHCSLSLPQDHKECLDCLYDVWSLWGLGCIKTYPCKHLLKLDEYVIHRPMQSMPPSFRTFVKVSVSDHIYALKGNTINYEPDIYDVTKHWEYKERKVERNCPIGEDV